MVFNLTGCSKENIRFVNHIKNDNLGTSYLESHRIFKVLSLAFLHLLILSTPSSSYLSWNLKNNKVSYSVNRVDRHVERVSVFKRMK